MSRFYGDLLDALLDVDDGMSNWEVKFVDDLDVRRQEWGNTMRLSEKQMVKLTELYDEHCL